MNKIIAGVATATLFAIASPVFASTGHGWFYSNNGGDITVTNNNSAHVQNTVAVNANTGYNTADGGNGDQGGNGGNATGSPANAGNGGAGGRGGNGGEIHTGNAIATSYVTNNVNRNKTVVTDGCGCDSSFGHNGQGDITVSNTSRARVANMVAVNANTGYNTADGGNGDQGGNGGNATGSHVWWWFQNNGAANAGNAGNGGAGGTGGLVVTGHADALSDIANVVNTNITRITRGL
ncbi:hypothetical protein AUJ44_01575 [Candidatus Nomurabacteria bacterium CG1_02_47_685]|uniref:PE-PGRS family protein n=1 Tax=Candidatus Nomurabacteria bacterium CG1_02_47_685 TaxID=1805282 RepID=A0A1J4VDF0_9BACT|nr:MAG: hypothetical protein AUJ44_01575 [Candidatus Nomurabacteria bacterium CG1_02_47_685]